MNRKNLSLTALAAIIGSASSYAATITQTVANGAGAGDDWDSAIWGTPAAGPTAGNDYVMDARVNTPDTETTPQTFAGDSLTLSGSGANFQVRARNGETDAITANLIFDGGKMQLNKTSTTYGLVKGTISVVSTTRIQTYQNDTSQRNFRIDSLISSVGTPTLELFGSINYTGAGNQYIEINNSSNTFAGVWDVTQVRSIFTSAGAAGSGSFTVNNQGYVRINESWNGTMTVVNGAEVNVGSGNTYTLDSLFVNATEITAAGTYTADELNTLTSSTVFSGPGNFVIIPEPSAAALSLLGTLGLLRRRR